MSKSFCIPGRPSVWNRSNGAVLLFLGHVQALEAHLRLQSGLAMIGYDEVHIDVDVLRRFVEHAAALIEQPTNDFIQRIVEPTVLYLCGLLLRVDDASVVPGLSEELMERSRMLMRSEPT